MTAGGAEGVPPSAAEQSETGAAEALLLMTPGPTRVPSPVLAAGAQPMLHHRTADFSTILAGLLERIKPLFGTADADVLPIHATGRGAMEAAIANLFRPGDAIVCCCNGKFGRMWAGFAEAYGLVVHRVATDLDVDVDAAEVSAALRDHPTARAVTLTHCDTTTGVLNDVEAVCAAARVHGALVMVDGISSIGGVPFELDSWGVDVAITASQKCLMSPPGLAFVALNERAWSMTETASLPRSYWDFGQIREFLAREGPETPGTTPVQSVRQVAEALSLIHQEGLANVYERHAAMGRAVRDRMSGLGLELQCPRLARFSPTLTAIAAPAGIDPGEIRSAMRQRGILIAVGLLDYRGRAFRIGHMGDIGPVDVERTLRALSEVLVGLERGVPR